jgi:hypothetical protein
MALSSTPTHLLRIPLGAHDVFAVFAYRVMLRDPVSLQVSLSSLVVPEKLNVSVFPLSAPVKLIVPVIGPGKVNAPERFDPLAVPARVKLMGSSDTNVAEPLKLGPD